LTRAIYEAVQAARLDESHALQLKLTALFDALLSAPEFPEGFRLGVELRGFRMGSGRQPLSESQCSQLQALAEVLKEKLAVAGIP
jgi:4-hydroxy-tetrahydrodipicolinate synthase